MGRARLAVDVTHFDVVVGTKETSESGLFGCLRHCQEIFVAGTLLGFGEDAKFHRDNRSSVSGCRARPGLRRGGERIDEVVE